MATIANQNGHHMVQQLLFFFLSSAKSLSDTFLGDALIKLYKTL
jgi:hypothetical protein